MAIYLRFALTDFVFKLTSLHGLLAGFPFGYDCCLSILYEKSATKREPTSEWDDHYEA